MSKIRMILTGLLWAARFVMADDPEVTVTRVPNMPNNLFYFDDTSVSNPKL